MPTPILTKRDIEMGALKPSEEAFNNAFSHGYSGEIKKQHDKAAADAKLAELIKGKQLDEQEFINKRERNISDTEKLRKLLGKDSKVHVGDVTMDPREATGVVLTPAQQAAESAGGKKVADYMTGGKASAEAAQRNLSDVESELQSGKRDWYDRIVGGALQSHPSAMGLLAPAEKARTDKAHNATLGALKAAGIARPTQWEVQKIFGHSYDPSSDDETNLARIQANAKKAAEMKAQAEEEAQNLQLTGYVTPGVGGNPRVGATQSQSPKDPSSNVGQKSVVKTEVSPSTGKKRITYSDGTQEIQ